MPGLVIPIEIWRNIAQFLPKSPLYYLLFAGISRSARSCFLADHLWKEFDIMGSGVDIGLNFIERVLSYNRLLQWIVYEGWKWLALPLPRPDFEALGFCLINDGSGLVSLSINIDSLHYCHNLANNPDVKFMVAIKVLSDMEKDGRLSEPFSPVEAMVMDTVDTTNASFMSLLCKYNRKACTMVANNLRMDPHFVLSILKSTGEFLAEGDLLQNREFALAAININPFAFSRLTKFHDDDEIAVKVISISPTQLSFASCRLQDNKDLVKLAVKSDGEALEYASERLQGDTEIVLSALRENGHAVEFVGEELLDDLHVKMTALENSAFLYQVCDEVPCSDKDLALVAVKHNTTNLQWLSPELQTDSQILRVAKENDVYDLMDAMRF